MKCFVNTSEIGRFFCLDEYPSFCFKKICADSRYVESGDLFFALPGEKTDGHQFIDEVQKRGAVCAVVRKDYQKKGDFPLLRVDDTLQALQKLAAEVLRRSAVKVIGVTGSIGKTTTKELLATLLEGKFKTVKSPRNYNSQIGLPLTLLNHLEGDEDYLVQEMGMTGSGQISRLIEIAPPQIALVTYVALVHAAFFDSIEDIARAKAEIFSHPLTKAGFFPDGISCRPILESIGKCLKKAVSMHHDPYGPLPFSGDHLRHNFLLAAAVAQECGLSVEEIEARIPYLHLPEKRQEHIELNGITFVNDSYNACAPSIIAAFQALPEPKNRGKRIAVLGEMLELGKFSEQCHKEVGEASLDKVDQMFCLGQGCRPIVEMWRSKKQPVSYFDDRAALVAELRKIIAPGDVVLLKGSNGKQLWKILEEV